MNFPIVNLEGVTCDKCGQPLVPGEAVVQEMEDDTEHGNAPTWTIYHLKCESKKPN